MNKTSLIYCIGSLVVSLLVAIVAFPYAAMDGAIVTAAATPKAAYEMGTVNVGDGFGEVGIEELMTYYINNPPAVASGVTATPKIRFGGC